MIATHPFLNFSMRGKNCFYPSQHFGLTGASILAGGVLEAVLAREARGRGFVAMIRLCRGSDETMASDSVCWSDAASA